MSCLFVVQELKAKGGAKQAGEQEQKTRAEGSDNTALTPKKRLKQ